MKKDVFDELIVVKRSGQRVNFNGYKIAVAIKKAYDSVYPEHNETEVNKIYENVLNYLEKNYTDRKTINEEDIQDIIEVEMKLVSEKVYKAFSEYRKKRAESRKVFKIKQQHKFAKAMEKIAESDILKSESNYTPTEILLKCGSTVMSEYTRAYIIDSKYLRAHEEGKIFIHDIDSFPLGKISHIHIDLRKCVENDVCLENLAEMLISMKNEVNGEINIPSIDKLLEPWILKRFKEIFKEYLINYLTLNGFDEFINLKKIEFHIEKLTSFDVDMEEFEILNSSIVVKNLFDKAYDDALKKANDIIKKALQRFFDKLITVKDRYGYSISFGTNNSSMGKIINEAILDYLENSIYLEKLNFIVKVNDLNSPFLRKIEELIPSRKNICFSFLKENASKNEIEYFANGMRIYEDNNDDEASSIGKMVVGTTSINMARLALECRGQPQRVFTAKFDEVLELVKNELLLTFETIGNRNKDNYSCLFTGNILGDERLLSGQKIRKIIKTGTLNIGLIGLKECVSILKDDEASKYNLLIDILQQANKKAAEFSSSTKLNFCISEPFDKNSSKEFAAFDKAIYGTKNMISDNTTYDLISNLRGIKDNYDMLSKIGLLFKGGNVVEYVVPKNASISKIHKTIESYYNSNVKFVRFTEEGWMPKCK